MYLSLRNIDLLRSFHGLLAKLLYQLAPEFITNDRYVTTHVHVFSIAFIFKPYITILRFLLFFLNTRA